jgi:hypothetical protein
METQSPGELISPRCLCCLLAARLSVWPGNLPFLLEAVCIHTPDRCSSVVLKVCLGVDRTFTNLPLKSVCHQFTECRWGVEGGASFAFTITNL